MDICSLIEQIQQAWNDDINFLNITIGKGYVSAFDNDDNKLVDFTCVGRK